MSCHQQEETCGGSIATSRTAVTAIAVTQIQLAFIFSHRFHGLIGSLSPFLLPSCCQVNLK